MKPHLGLSAALVSLLLLANVNAGRAASGEIYTASISRFALNTGERVTAFEIKIGSGAVKRMENIPVGWHLIIDNDASWQTKVTATIEVGAAALDVEAFRKIVLTVEKHEFMDNVFALSGEMHVTTDFENERILLLGHQDFSVTPVKN